MPPSKRAKALARRVTRPAAEPSRANAISALRSSSLRKPPRIIRPSESGPPPKASAFSACPMSQGIADRRMRRWPFPFDLEGFVQLAPMHLDVRANASIRIGAADHRENGKQQHVRQLVQFAFGPTRVADSREERKQGFERLQGDLRDSVASDRFR